MPDASLLAETQANRVRTMMGSGIDSLQREWFATADGTGDGMRAAQGALMATANALRNRLARSEEAFLTRYARQVSGHNIPTVGVDARTWSTETMRGIPDSKLWHRPIATYFTAKAEGHNEADALKRGWYRAREIGDEQFQLTRTWVAREAVKGMKADGYIRKPSRAACALCMAAAVKKYRTGELMPIHPHCRCTILPTFNGQKAPSVQRDLPVAGMAGIATVGAAVAALAVREHGELGPTLTWRQQDFTGPSDI